MILGAVRSLGDTQNVQGKDEMVTAKTKRFGVTVDHSTTGERFRL